MIPKKDSLPEIRLLVTFAFWARLGWPWAQTATHPPLLKDSYPWAASVDLGAVVASILPSFPHFLHTSAPTISSRGRLNGSKLTQLCSLCISIQLSRALSHHCVPGQLSWLPWSQHSAHQQDCCFPNWGPQMFCLRITWGAVRMHRASPQIYGVRMSAGSTQKCVQVRRGARSVCRWGLRNLFRWDPGFHKPLGEFLCSLKSEQH